jgi:hypothetical protein
MGTTSDLFTLQSSGWQHSDEDNDDIIIVIIFNVKVKFSSYRSTMPSMKAYWGMKSDQLLSPVAITQRRKLETSI